MTEMIECECGMFIRGQSSATAKENLKKHMKSSRHKEQLAAKMLSGKADAGGHPFDKEAWKKERKLEAKIQNLKDAEFGQADTTQKYIKKEIENLKKEFK